MNSMMTGSADAWCMVAGAALIFGACGEVRVEQTGECPVLPSIQAATRVEHRSHPRTRDSVTAATVSWPEYVLTADSGYALPGKGVAHLCGVHLVVTDSLGQIIAEVTAATGDFEREREAVVARGSVVVELPREGRRIETEELHYEPRENRVWSPTATTFHERGATIKGESFSADRYFHNLRVERARGRFTFP